MKLLNLHLVEEKLLSLNLKMFTPRDLRLMFNTSQRSVEGFLNYNLKKGVFVRFRRNLYGLKRNLPNQLVLANKMYLPSYISLDTALAYHNLIPETVYMISSITTKATREFVFENQVYEYRRIKVTAYTGYEPVNVNGEIVYLATPEKAVTDFWYFVFLGKREFNSRLKMEKISKSQLINYSKLYQSVAFTRFISQKMKKND